MKSKIFPFLILLLITSYCGNENQEPKSTTQAKESVKPQSNTNAENGIGPIKHIELGSIDLNLAAKGKEVFNAKCSACHKISKRVVGPALKGVTDRRTPEWIMNMILNPEEMVAKDPQAKQLLAEYLAPMANQNLTTDEARQILEYLRTKSNSSED